MPELWKRGNYRGANWRLTAQNKNQAGIQGSECPPDETNLRAKADNKTTSPACFYWLLANVKKWKI